MNARSDSRNGGKGGKGGDGNRWHSERFNIWWCMYIIKNTLHTVKLIKR